jgi:hypothetical protein
MTESFRLGLNNINHTFYSPLALPPKKKLKFYQQTFVSVFFNESQGKANVWTAVYNQATQCKYYLNGEQGTMSSSVSCTA